jgi:hypothetical protein
MPGVDSIPPDPVADTLRGDATRFMAAWRKEWLTSRRERDTYYRMASLHCHYDGSWESGAPNIIRSEVSRRSFCPIWFPAEDSLAADESNGVDASLPEERRTTVRRSRADLIARFETAARTRPSNPWLVGQLVRLAVDQDDIPTALRVARACTASRPWCDLLEGYVLHAAGRTAAADSTFLRATAAMKPAERCEWTSIAPLLDTRSRAAYERIGCADRDSVHATFWWLADPLYIEPGNARRAEHFARQVLVRLHAGLTMDERWDWRERYGGDALATMIVRYGWPSSLHWAGLLQDGGHFGWLAFRDSAVNVAPEYKLPRYHSTPPWHAVLDPSTLTSADGSRFAPRLAYGAIDWDNDFWPQEHAERKAGPVLEVAEQTVMFRRDNDVLIAIALDVPQKFFAPGARIPYDGAIIAARDANDRWTPSRASYVLDGKGTTILVASLLPRAHVVSAELAPADGAPGLAVRARRAVRPPAPLSVAQAGEIAVSDPLFFRPGDADDQPKSAPVAIARMLGSHALADQRVGIFWETYGVAPSDTVDLTLRITGIDKPGVLRRIGTAIRVLQSTPNEITMSWREPNLGQREGLTWAGDVPIQARSVILDVSRLRPGRYTMELTVVKGTAAPAVTRRDVTIVR